MWKEREVVCRVKDGPDEDIVLVMKCDTCLKWRVLIRMT